MNSLFWYAMLLIMQVQASRADPLPVCHGSCRWNSHPRCEPSPLSMITHSLPITVHSVVRWASPLDEEPTETFLCARLPGFPYAWRVTLQVLNKLGALNLPDWWNAGKVAQDNSPIPFSEFPSYLLAPRVCISHCCAVNALVCATACLETSGHCSAPYLL